MVGSLSRQSDNTILTQFDASMASTALENLRRTGVDIRLNVMVKEVICPPSHQC